MAGIFLSYRRDDSGGHAGRVADRLVARFGADRLFMDVQDIHPGQDFATAIEKTVASCECLVAVIGPRWAEMARQRADAGDDFVRYEITAALKRNVAVIPVLVGGARMPAAHELPSPLAGVARRQAIDIRDDRFDADIVVLEETLAGLLDGADDGPGSRPRSNVRWLAIAAALLVLIAASAGYWLSRSPDTRGGIQATAVGTPTIAGDWVAQMQRPGQPPFNIRLSLQQLGDKIAGVVSYPTGDGTIQDAVLDGRSLTFSTTHVPQFESTPATITFQAEVRDDEIALMASYDAGVATGVAHRASSPSTTNP